MVDKLSSVPLYIQIRDKLYEQIKDGNLTAGGQVPSELELVAQYGVSRMTARKALDMLVARGILYRQRGKGTFVAENIVSYNLSTMLSFSSTLRTLGYTITTRVLNQDITPAPANVLEKLKLNANSQVILIRRLRYVDGKPAAIHTSFMDAHAYAPILNANLEDTSLLAVIENLCGIRVAYTKDTVQAALVSREDMGLLEVKAASPVLHVEGVAFSENGQPTRFTRAIYRGDLFTLSVTNRGDQRTLLEVTDVPERLVST